MKIPSENSVKAYILFDGSCGFCSRSMRWVAAKDSQHRLLFVSNQSQLGQDLMRKREVEKLSKDSILYISLGGGVAEKSQAIYRMVQHLPGYRYLGILFSLLPKGLLDGLYSGVARVRKRLPGTGSCSNLPIGISEKIIW